MNRRRFFGALAGVGCGAFVPAASGWVPPPPRFTWVGAPEMWSYSQFGEVTVATNLRAMQKGLEELLMDTGLAD